MSNKWTRNQKILVAGLGVSTIIALVAIGTLFVQVRYLGQKIQPIIEMKPKIVNVINNITKVEKEVANINAVIQQYYGNFRTEVFKEIDLGKKMAIYPDPRKPEKDSVIFFQLQSIPEKNSVEILDNFGMQAPGDTYLITSNIIALSRSGRKPVNLLKNDKAFYTIKYIPDTISGKKILTIGEPKIVIKGDKIRITYE